MMGEGMPAATATPMSAPGASSSPAASPGAAQAQSTQAAASRDETQPDTGPGAFDLLLANAPATANPASGSASRPGGDEAESASAGDIGDGSTGADPLLLVLAQVLPQAMPANPSMPAAGPAAVAATAVSMTGAAAAGQASASAPAQSGAAQRATDATLPSAAFTTNAAADANASPTAAGAPPADGASAAFELPRLATSAAETNPQPVLALPVGHAAAPHAPAASAPATATPTLSQPADPAAGYDDSFGTQVTWLAEQRIGEAQIRVSPEHLGAIDIRLQLDGRDVRAEFHSAQPEVRQALEASLPRLRDMLGQHGLQLAHAGVGQGQKQRDGTPFAATPGTTSQDEGDAVLPPGIRRTRGLVDVYA